MACAECGSANQTKCGAEVNIHFPGPMSLDEPGFFVSPKLVVCMDCGFSHFALREHELSLLKKTLAYRRRAHNDNYADAA